MLEALIDWEAFIGIFVSPLIDPASRTYFVYLLPALLVTGLFAIKAVGLRGGIRRLRSLGPGYFFSASSAVDVALLVTNGLLKLLLFVPVFGSSLLVAITVGSVLQDNLGDANFLQDMPLYGITLAFSGALFVFDDFTRFCTHYLMHRLPLLWSLHKVHHSATVLTPLTIYRVHPIESAIYFLRAILAYGVVIGGFVWLFGRSLSGLEVLGVNAFGFMFNLAFANLRHSHVYLSFGPLEKLFVSPAQHQLHHSADHRHVNLGSALAIWDQLLGTWKGAGIRPETLMFGIKQTAAPSLNGLAKASIVNSKS